MSFASSGHSAPQSHLTYRPDIDGLRAIAVISVIGFHAFPDFLPGGFVGVDLFFVISGYLITSIILKSIQDDSFSILGFYRRRVFRIFPALILVLSACLVVGWGVLLSDEYKHLGRHVTGGALFVSNLVLWKESGYFDVAAEFKPLLHLWSLGIEEQFYLFWPLCLLVLKRLRQRFLSLILIAAILSFVHGLYLLDKDAVVGFYAPTSRFWELLCGALLAAMATRQPGGIFSKQASLIAASGLLLLLLALAFIDRTARFPGYWALLPTLAAFLIIHAGPTAWLNREILSHRFLVAIGLISYPLYLWHWPLLAFPKIILGQTPDAGVRLVLVATAGLFAWLTYRVVEKNIRQRHSNNLIYAALLGGMLLIAVTGAVAPRTEKLLAIPRGVDVINPTGNDQGDQGHSRPCKYHEARPETRALFSCQQDARGAPTYAVMGDSKAEALYRGLFRTSQQDGRWIFLGSGERGPLISVMSDHPVYARYDQEPIRTALDLVASDPEIKVVALVTATRALFQLKTDDSIEDLPGSPNYQPAFDGLKLVVEKLLQSGKRVVLVVDNPTFPDPKLCIQRGTAWNAINHLLPPTGTLNPQCSISLDRHAELTRQYRLLLEAMRELAPDKITVFDPVPLLCDSHTGHCGIMLNGRQLYGHTDHISDYAAGIVGAALNLSASSARIMGNTR